LKEDFKEFPIYFGLLDEGWEENDDLQCSCCRRGRSIRVRNDLAQLSQVLISGGNWKGLKFRPHTGKNDLHVMLVSHGGFLSTLKYTGPLLEEEPKHGPVEVKVNENKKQWFHNAEICSCTVRLVEWYNDEGVLERPIFLEEVGGLLGGGTGTLDERRPPRE
jgi:hypothetical protein